MILKESKPNLNLSLDDEDDDGNGIDDDEEDLDGDGLPNKGYCYLKIARIMPVN